MTIIKVPLKGTHLAGYIAEPVTWGAHGFRVRSNDADFAGFIAQSSFKSVTSLITGEETETRFVKISTAFWDVTGIALHSNGYNEEHHLKHGIEAHTLKQVLSGATLDTAAWYIWQDLRAKGFQALRVQTIEHPYVLSIDSPPSINDVDRSFALLSEDTPIYQTAKNTAVISSALTSKDIYSPKREQEKNNVQFEMAV